MDLEYLSGFGNEFASEALPGALPVGQNSPQKAPYGLYTELFSGTAFTMARSEARRTWLYRIQPSANHPAFVKLARQLAGGPLGAVTPNRLRWNPLDIPSEPTDFIDGLVGMVANSGSEKPSGISIYNYRANRSMERVFFNADGELLIVPEQGRLRIATELGVLDVEPLEIVVLPRGLKFRVELLDAQARGYVAENHGAPLRLPDLGPIGSNGLANPRDFLTPVARYEDLKQPTTLVQKFLGELWACELDHSPLNVVAWHGNNVPYKYDLRRFNTIGTVSFDHPDPSIFTVLTSPTSVHGAYDAKAEGFLPGGASLHSCMSAHGPDGETCTKAINADLAPHKIDNTMAFMFETSQVLRPTQFALECPQLQPAYDACWASLPATFNPNRR